MASDERGRKRDWLLKPLTMMNRSRSSSSAARKGLSTTLQANNTLRLKVPLRHTSHRRSKSQSSSPYIDSQFSSHPTITRPESQTVPDAPKSPPSQLSDLWGQAFRNANDTTQKWLKEQGLDFQSSDGTQIKTQIKEVISLMKSKEVSENVSEPLAITIANRKIIVREYLADAVAFITMVGDAAIVFAPPQASVPWTVAKAVMKIPVNSIEQKAALVGTIEWFLRITRRGQIYESLYTTETTDEGALSNLHNALVELYTAAIELLAKFDTMAKGGAFKELLTAVLSPKYATDLVANLNKKEEILDREAQSCEASRSAKSSEDMKVQTEAFQKQLAQLTLPLPRIDVAVSSLLEKVKDKELEELMDYISSEMFGKGHATVTNARVEKTGDWLLSNDYFRAWQDIPSSSTVFVLKGAGGTGKTYLTSRVIDYVKGFAYFYCNRSGSSMQQPIIVLRSFVRQLSGKAFDDSESFNFYSKTTIILDALDETDIGTYNLAKSLIQMTEKSKRPVKIFISSRPDREELEEEYKDNLLITVDASNQHEDIQKYLEHELYSTKKFKRLKPEIQGEIKDIFNKKACGILNTNPVLMDEVVHDWSQNLPDDLTEAYNDLWKNIQRQHESVVALAERAIQWVLCSIEPLESKSLLEAIQYTIEGSTVVDKGKQLQQEILSLCQDLLTIDEERDVWMLPHASVAEYFESKGWTGRKCDAFAAKTCLGFLEYFQPKEIQEGFFAYYANYNWHKHVGRYDKWLGSKKEEEADPSVAAALKRFLGSPNEGSDSYRKWAERDSQMRPTNMALFAMCRYGFYYTLRNWWQDGKITEEMALLKNEDGQNSLALAAENGCMPICRHLMGSIDAMHPDAERHAGALVAALKNGNDDVFKMLVMEANADVNFPDGKDNSAAQYAAQVHPEMLQWMVDHSLADLEKENESGNWMGNVLIAAAGRGNVESIRILLGAGANVNATVQNGTYGSALVAVAALCMAEGHVEIARLLLNSGADPNLPLRGGNFGSALEASARILYFIHEESEELVCKVQNMLLEAGAEPTALFNRGEHGSALAAAAFYGQLDFLRAMVDRVGVECAINILRQGRHPGERMFRNQQKVERWKDTAAYLANEVGASKDVLRCVGLWDVDPVPAGYGELMEIQLIEHGQQDDVEDSSDWSSCND
ncbi:hypothetical protein TRIATDRAFT_131580 [Trichoderma atroviride IMI 206040]|uniref:Uncharacterized protein n=1 Tax=Hypocrea atroviridis (strain ATCC 20476 / IMI 206040) TaxID=452589 RepID=G9NYQ7_HYPAI|nr:uncharacterized protein TRIATDRAFT_131580 [Trichoderma atroviride IMI 206040]EHK44513.1 hypothetical protein TRIATDRAFT_131580 [Trichoderma atroviride IMI 206040]